MKKRLLFIVILLNVSILLSRAQTGLFPGYIAPEIKLKTIDGQKVALKDLSGKMVIIYFWASWSEHSRVENPKMKELYQEFRNSQFEEGKGLVVYSVALEKDKGAWFAAIQKDGISTFVNVSELKFLESKAAKDYNIKAIPMTFLLNGNGVILVSGMNSEALRDKLNSLLSENTRIVK
jgi:thiol-disulfide isomerase/thioredoxin